MERSELQKYILDFRNIFGSRNTYFFTSSQDQKKNKSVSWKTLQISFIPGSVSILQKIFCSLNWFQPLLCREQGEKPQLGRTQSLHKSMTHQLCNIKIFPTECHVKLQRAVVMMWQKDILLARREKWNLTLDVRIFKRPLTQCVLCLTKQ